MVARRNAVVSCAVARDIVPDPPGSGDAGPCIERAGLACLQETRSHALRSPLAVQKAKMLFPTLDFALFFMVVFVAAWSLRDRASARKAMLLAASYFFYGYWDWRFLALLAGSSALNYAAGLAIASAAEARARKWIAGLAVAANLMCLGFFKYYNFFIEGLTDILIAVGWQRDLPFLEVILPIGISFFTFQGISYVADVYRGHVKPVRSPLDLFLYISFFPQLVAGPIVRASHFLPQLEKRPELTRLAAAYGFVLILSGMFKKTVVAHYIAVDLVDPVFAMPSAASSFDLFMAHYAYAVQVYCDFSGYSDIAIGTAALLGFRFRKNFDRPFAALSLQQLWQRWHISLSAWLRDYLYRTLRGEKRDAGLRMYRNLFLTMLLGGLWHGANWTFLVWGAMHGAALVIERIVKGRYYHWRIRRVGQERADSETGGFAGAFAGWFITFHVFTFAAIFFRSPDIGIAWEYIVQMASFSGAMTHFSPFLLVLIAGSVALQFLPGDAHERVARKAAALPVPFAAALFAFALLLIEYAGPVGVAPFIYFQF